MARPEIVIVAAIAEKNRVIGKAGKLPWTISEDLKRFKRLTINHPVVMGRKTFESIVGRLGKPLPERRNVVLTAKPGFPDHPDVEAYDSLELALDALKHESRISVIGGESLFAGTLPKADRLELTMVEGNYDGDAFFPEYEHLIASEFRLEAVQKRKGYRFETYRRVR